MLGSVDSVDLIRLDEVLLGKTDDESDLTSKIDSTFGNHVLFGFYE